MLSSLQRLAEWYSSQCNGDWEHSYGITISTLDNPGFAIDIALAGTALESKPYEERKDSYESSDRWMICRRTAERFEGRGAPSRLDDIITEFLMWSEPNQ
jgi:Immunity protein 53